MSLLARSFFRRGLQRMNGQFEFACCLERTWELISAFSFARLGLLIGLLLLQFNSQAVAQTSVSGAITANTQWTLAGSPYIVTNDLVVQNGAMLTIDAGVTIYMGANASVTIHAGVIQAQGVASNGIRVLSDKSRLGQAAAPGDWNQWVFNSGTTNTRLEYVLFEHGRGLSVNGAAPILNYIDVRNHQGAAITIDLAASPSGVGNRAIGNTLNGIAVPAGDIAGSVQWGLRGIPYVVASGTVSVGASPTITGVTPSVIQQGESLTMSVSGTHLSGLSASSLSAQGLTLQTFAGASDSQINFQVKAESSASLGAAALRLLVNAGEVVFPNAITVTQPLPAITSIQPASIYAGQGPTEIAITGRNFTDQSAALFNSGAVSTQFISATELRASLPNQTAVSNLPIQVRRPDPLNNGEYVTSNAVTLTVLQPVPPVLTIEPAPLAVPPDSKPHEITLRLSKADIVAHTVTFSISDPAKATVSPTSVVFAAGQTIAKVSITPKSLGAVSLIADSATMQRVTMPIFITQDFRGVNTAYSQPVGVVVEGATDSATSAPMTAASSLVGVAVGPLLTSVTPTGWTIGATQTFVIRGVAIPANVQIEVLPAAGVTIGAATVSPDGARIDVPITAATDAAVGLRRLIIKEASGAVIAYADAAKSQVYLSSGLPVIDSIAPIQAAHGSIANVTVRGKHLQFATVRILPDSGIQIDSAPQVSVDGSVLTVSARIESDAVSGPRVVQIVTPAGETASVASATNTLHIVSSIQQAVTPIVSPTVGIVVGNVGEVSEESTVGPIHGPFVGVLVGSAAVKSSPRSVVIGTEAMITVQGQGLSAVTAVTMIPNNGVTLTAPVANAEGTQLTFTATVNSAAPLGNRRIVLSTATGVIPFSDASESLFLVAAPTPELTAVAPQIIRAGAPAVTVNVKGRNFHNVTSVRVEPSLGLTVIGPINATSDGAELTFNLQADATVASGIRTIIVTTAGGVSSAEPQSFNTLQIARELGPTYSGIASPVVGVMIGSSVSTPESVESGLITSLVGVVIETPPVDESIGLLTNAPAVGLVVGVSANGVNPNGWLKGASGSITISGFGLGQVTSAVVSPTDGILLGNPVVNADATRLEIPITVAPNAPETVRKLTLRLATGEAPFIQPQAAIFGIGSLPTMTSIAPIILEQGKGSTVVVRGSNLRGVTRVVAEPLDGLLFFNSGLTWSEDALGEKLTVSLDVGANATLGARVIRLEVPGGMTSATANPSNSVNVVAPQ
jgi:hypothetical protein